MTARPAIVDPRIEKLSLAFSIGRMQFPDSGTFSVVAVRPGRFPCGAGVELWETAHVAGGTGARRVCMKGFTSVVMGMLAHLFSPQPSGRCCGRR
jgi:hypothetical protein